MNDQTNHRSGASYAAAGVDIEAGDRAVELFTLARVGCGQLERPLQHAELIGAASQCISRHQPVVDLGTADPAVAGALEDQIMVDPALVQQANADAITPAIERGGRCGAMTVARAGAAPGGTHGSHSAFMPSKSAMSAR